MGKKNKKSGWSPPVRSVVAGEASAEPTEAPSPAEPSTRVPDTSDSENRVVPESSDHDVSEDESNASDATPSTNPFAKPPKESGTVLLDDTLAMENAGLRAKCLSLEEKIVALTQSHHKELESVKRKAAEETSAAKSELSTVNAMSSAQRAKLDFMSETVESFEQQLEEEKENREENIAAAVAQAVAVATNEAGEDLKNKLQSAEDVYQSKLQSAVKTYADISHTAIAKEREALRVAYVVHASAKVQWAVEKISLLEQKGDQIEVEINDAKRIAKYARVAVSNCKPGFPTRGLINGDSDDDERGTSKVLVTPSAALRALFAATTPQKIRAALDEARADIEKEKLETEAAVDSSTPLAKSGATGTESVDKPENDAEANGNGTSSSGSESESNDDKDEDGEKNQTKENDAKKLENILTTELDNPLADLLNDAMEVDIASCIARGYCVDESDGSLVVGASAIVEQVIQKYKGNDSVGAGGSKGKLSPLFAATNAGTPNRRSMDEQVSVGKQSGEVNRSTTSSTLQSLALRLEREKARKERGVLLAELQQTRAMVDLEKLKNKSEESNSDETIDALTSQYAEEEQAALHRLSLAAEMRAVRAESELTRVTKKLIPPHALKAILNELSELKVKLKRLRDVQETSQRLVAPSIASALACLSMREPEGVSPGRYKPSTAMGGTPKTQGGFGTPIGDRSFLASAERSGYL